MLKSMLICLALTGYHEARGEPLAAQVGVQKVLYNRAVSRHTTVCDELNRDKQFTFMPVPSKVLDKCSWVNQMRIARSVMLLGVRGIDKKYLYFNERYLGVRYKTGNKPVKIGKLIFY
jgi:spore germination cell wall hydrolase CwlJ-like protein